MNILSIFSHFPALCFILCWLNFLFSLSVNAKTGQVAIEVEREEDEGGTVGETFMDYVSVVPLDFML